MSNVRTIYSVVSLFVIAVLIFLLVKVLRSNSRYKYEVMRTILYGIPALFVYSCFVLNIKNVVLAEMLDAVFFALTDFLALSMMRFVFDYVYEKHFSFKYYIPCYLIATVDTFSLLTNFRYHHMFRLAPCITYFSKYSLFFWSKEFFVVQYLHLFFCYIMVFTTFMLLLFSTIKSSIVYKSKYFNILLSYIVVIASNCFCYMADAPIDFSVILYSVLGGLICYFAVFSTPKKLIYKTLHSFYGGVKDALVFYDTDGKCIYANNEAKKVLSGNGGFTKAFAESYRKEWLGNQSESEISLNVISGSATLVVDCMERKFLVEYQELFYTSRKVPFGSYMKFQDRTEEIESFLRERFLSTHDSLTGVYNREYFLECVNKKLRELAAQKSETEYIMLCSNIKGFKLVNELFGQETGDKIINKQAEFLRRLCSSSSIYGRINDDKFALFMKKENFNPSVFKSSIEAMRRLAENSTYSLHITIGVCEVFSNTETAQGLYDKAKMAIDAVGNDFQHIFTYYDSNLMERILIEKNVINDFDAGIKNGQFVPYLQPMVDLNGKLVGAEVLTRWKHPEKGVLSPGFFVQILEKASCIQRLDEYIWEESVKLASKWNNMDFFLSLNVSSRDIFYMDIYSKIMELCTKYQVSPAKICIEFPEQVLTDNFKKAVELFDTLQKNGFRIAIDKFGSGYSSLNMLKDIKVDVLKTDRAFLEENDTLERNAVILESVISMSKALDIKTVILGVENPHQCEFIKSIGGQYFQGYYYSQAVSEQEFSDKYL